MGGHTFPTPLRFGASCGVLLLVFAGASAAVAQTSATDITPSGVSAGSTRVASGFSAFFEADARYYNWRGSRGSNVFDLAPGKGSQFYSPFTFGFDYQVPETYRFQVRAKSGYVSSNHATAGQQASIDTMVDTQLTAVWTYLGSEDNRPFIGVALNLPTGTTVLPGNQRLTRMDPDLVEIGSYGAGFNINPTAGFIFALTENTAISLSGGYSWQGPFDKEAFNPSSRCSIEPPPCAPLTFDITRRIDPGNVATANINTSSIFNNLAIKTSFAYMSETYLKEDGLRVGRTGPKLVANLAVTYRIDPRWAVLVNGSWTYTKNNRIPGFDAPYFTTEPFVTEPKNSNSHLVIAMVEPQYAVTDRLKAAVNYSFLWRRENYYDFTEEQFIPAKTKHSAGASLSYVVTPTSSINLRGSYFWVEIDDGPFLPAGQLPVFPVVNLPSQFYPPHLSYTGWTAALSGRIQF